jgi:hypothetical protein
MVPSSLTLTILAVAFLLSSFAYIFGWPKRRLVNPYFAVLGSIGGLMLFILILDILDIRIVWFSWLLLLAAFGLLAGSVKVLRMSLEVQRAHNRAVAERRARGG